MAARGLADFSLKDFTKSELESNLQLVSCMEVDIQGDYITFSDIQRHFHSLPKSQSTLLSQVARLVKFVLLVPATNAVSERSASVMFGIKMYLRTTMTQLRLNIVMMLHIHKDLTLTLINHQEILSEFASTNEDRIRHFGHF